MRRTCSFILRLVLEDGGSEPRLEPFPAGQGGHGLRGSIQPLLGGTVKTFCTEGELIAALRALFVESRGGPSPAPGEKSARPEEDNGGLL